MRIVVTYPQQAMQPTVDASLKPLPHPPQISKARKTVTNMRKTIPFVKYAVRCRYLPSLSPFAVILVHKSRVSSSRRRTLGSVCTLRLVMYKSWTGIIVLCLNRAGCALLHHDFLHPSHLHDVANAGYARR